MNPERAKVAVRGAVQGVGFRPFVYRLASELRLKGWVLNSSQGVLIEAEGPSDALLDFLLRLEKEKPPRAIIQSMEFSILDAVGYKDFNIQFSEQKGAKTVSILPDSATCAECLLEIADPRQRRYRYPFTNCTNCGPRFTIIEELPYDRPNTSMKKFKMCADCEREYHNPLDRRFHAQPNACPRCGPRVELWDTEGNVLSQGEDPLAGAAEAIRAGKILALKGLGGFHLMVDARDNRAVARLRERKRREEKPLALMYPTMELVRRDCRVTELEDRLLLSPEAPIVLLRRRAGASRLTDSLAPGNPCLGVMLPYTPLHHILMGDLGFPVVATSGNVSGEPICIDEREALVRLNGIADLFLVHNRPIVRHVDDSVLRLIRGRELVLRRARGYAPLPFHAKSPLPTALALGAHLKNSVALSVGRDIFISQHIGDLEAGEAFAAFRKVAADLPRLYDAAPGYIACDLHPDYLSTKQAARMVGEGAAIPHPVQHHWAHVLACMAENELEPPVLGVAWDGTGYGLDGTIWGGEFLRAKDESFERAAHFRTFRLPGGEAAIKQPRRCALGILHEMGGLDVHQRFARTLGFSENELALIQRMLVTGLNAPVTSSAGRLFDAVASIIGQRQHASFEGQAAMELEFAVQPGVFDFYPFKLTAGHPTIVDWQPMIEAILSDVREGLDRGLMAAKFHNTLVEIIVAVARDAAEQKVALTGGCFQNRYLTERCVERLSEEGFRPYWHQRVPPNDGGIALGQIMSLALGRAVS